MNRSALTALGVAVALLGLIAYSSVFTVHETKQALVLQFGEYKRTVSEAGIHFKLPFVQNVVFMEDRILDLDTQKQEVIASDKKRIVVDAYARFVISDPLMFYQAVGDEFRARSRLGDVLNSSLRKALGRVELQTVLSGERDQLMRSISQDVQTEAQKFGIRIVDVRIKRADLPEANSQAVFRRMESEREREAREARARGAEEAQKIRADADRQRTVLIAEARKQAEILRGEGEAESNAIYAQSYGQDPEFFAFYRSMQAYRQALTGDNTTFVMSPQSEFFSYLENARANPMAPRSTEEGVAGAAAAAATTRAAELPVALPVRE